MPTEKEERDALEQQLNEVDPPEAAEDPGYEAPGEFVIEPRHRP